MEEFKQTGTVVALFLPAISTLYHAATNQNPRVAKFVSEIIVPSFLLFVSKQPTSIFTFVVWKPLTMFLSRGIQVAVQDNENAMLRAISRGGPLGRGCSKVVEVVVAVVLWTACNRRLPTCITLLAQVPSLDQRRLLPAFTLLVVFSAAVMGVLHAWSLYANSRGSHSGLQEVVGSTAGRPLNSPEHLRLAALAFINAICEEVTSRGFVREEFRLVTKCSPFLSNLSQAIIFGSWHFHGVPSGWTGVTLTTVYGFLMGLLCDWFGQSLWIPFLTHALADYYIFAVIARRSLKRS